MRLVALVAFIITVTVVQLYAAPDFSKSELIGTVQLKNAGRIDAVAKNSLNSLAEKIVNKGENGIVIVSGVVPSAKKQGDFLVKSAFLARGAAEIISAKLPSGYYAFINVSKFDKKKRSGASYIEIRFYPYEVVSSGEVLTLKEWIGQHDEENMHPAVKSVPSASVISVNPDKDSSLGSPATPIAVPGTLPERSLSSERAVVPSSSVNGSRKAETAENPELANELVLKAKARAAKRAKQLENRQ